MLTIAFSPGAPACTNPRVVPHSQSNPIVDALHTRTASTRTGKRRAYGPAPQYLRQVGDVAKVGSFVCSEGKTVGTAAFNDKTFPGDGTSREPPSDPDRRFVFVGKRGSFSRPRTWRRGGGDTRIT